MKKSTKNSKTSTQIKKLQRKAPLFNDEKFWNKVTLYAATAGFEVIQKALWLYYTAQKPDIPKWARRTIYGALFYFVNPFDALADIVPFFGFSDDLAMLALAVSTLAFYIDDEVKQKTDAKIDEWFSPDKKKASAKKPARKGYLRRKKAPGA